MDLSDDGGVGGYIRLSCRTAAVPTAQRLHCSEPLYHGPSSRAIRPGPALVGLAGLAGMRRAGRG